MENKNLVTRRYASSPTTRFAPSPTGRLHLGHAYSALFAEDAARREGGRFLLRMEDIDASRCRPEFADGILEDLRWLGGKWDGDIRYQSDHFDAYANALDKLEKLGLLYPCFCSRKEIAAEIAGSRSAPHLEMSRSAPHAAPQLNDTNYMNFGPDGPVYPGTCRDLTADDVKARKAEGKSYALRLRMDLGIRAATEMSGGKLSFQDLEQGTVIVDPLPFGDVVLARKDTPTSYHLAVTVDDAVQEINLITRGLDLFSATHVHRLLQAVLDLPVPNYHHHKLILGDDGRRLATRFKAATLDVLRAGGKSAAQIRDELGFAPSGES